MKISKNITEAQKNYPEMYHVVNSNEVHSFKTRDKAIKDLNEATDAEEKIGGGFTAELIEE